MWCGNCFGMNYPVKNASKRIVALCFLCLLVGSVAVRTARADDAWMTKIALVQLDRAANGEQLDDLAAQVEGAILARLSTGKLKNLNDMTDLVYVIRACRFGKLAMELKFDRTGVKAKAAKRAGMFADGSDLFKWLLSNRDFSRVLFREMQDVAEPLDSLKAIAELKAVGDKRLLAYTELAVAFATSRSASCYHAQPAAASIVDAFKYYTTRKMRFDLKAMPYELSRYLADTKLSIKERQWAYGKYNRYPNPAKCYFDLKYDNDHLVKGDPKKISKLAFTLDNLRKVGGVCIEQAYYSSQVCKALGIPAQIVTGRSGDGGYHAWTMCFIRKRGSRSAGWDSSTGRYEEQKYFVGDVQNPASGEKILDCELMLEGAASMLAPVRRQDADTATALAVLAADVANAARVAEMTDLKAMATLYKKQFERSPVDPESLKGEIKIDMRIVEEFLQMALEQNLAHRPAWDFIVELRNSRDMLKVGNLNKYFDVLTAKTAKAYPDYSCEIFLRIVPSIPDYVARMKIYQRALGVYGARRDLQGRILIACGDDCADRDKPALALKFYETAATKNVDLASIVTVASGKAEKLLVDADRAKLAALMYAKLFKAARKPRKVSSVFAEQNSYYILGQRLATLLETTGEAKRAQKIRALLKR